MAHGLASEQCAHDVDALAQTGVPHRLRGPTFASDVLVHRFAAAERDPEASGKHLGQRGRCLCDDRGVVTLPGRVDHTEGKRRRLQRCTQPGPGEPGFALPRAPGRKVIRAHRRSETRRLRSLHCVQQRAGVNLLVRGMEPNHWHALHRLTRHATPAAVAHSTEPRVRRFDMRAANVQSIAARTSGGRRGGNSGTHRLHVSSPRSIGCVSPPSDAWGSVLASNAWASVLEETLLHPSKQLTSEIAPATDRAWQGRRTHRTLASFQRNGIEAQLLPSIEN